MSSTPGAALTSSAEFPIRVDLHCHSNASSEAGEAVLEAFGCPESYSRPQQVYDLAKRRGMNFVTLSDHDCITGLAELAAFSDVFVGEELTCFFPEDRCKIHLLVWGITPFDHEQLQRLAPDIYQVADYVAQHHIAHSVAHPLYRQNDRLEQFHLERLLLLFKGFECLNGAHSALHRQTIDEVIDSLDERTIRRLSREHCTNPRWEEPWVKSRTGGSDDHGLLNIGRTWTEFPADVTTPTAVLDALRQGRCRPGGEAGSSLKLAHCFYGVGARYYGRRILATHGEPTTTSVAIGRLTGEPVTLSRRARLRILASRSLHACKRIIWPQKPKPATGSQLFAQLFSRALSTGLDGQESLRRAIDQGLAPLAEHDAMFDLVSGMNRDVTSGITDALKLFAGKGQVRGLMDSLSTVAAQQLLLLPYYFSFFHQNRERHLLARIAGRRRDLDSKQMKVALFTDTYDEINGVARFVKDMDAQATAAGVQMTIHTCSAQPKGKSPNRKNFQPLFSCEMPAYPDQVLTLPPLLEIMRWADEQQFDAVHVDSPGPMGLAGWAVARMLRVPMLATYHTDFPAYVRDYTGDHRLSVMTEQYMRWFHGEAKTIFTRSRAYEGMLREMGLTEQGIVMVPPGIDTEKFNHRHQDENLWQRLGVKESKRLLYVGRVAVEKNLAMLGRVFRSLAATRSDTALVIAGDGPFMAKMKEELAGLPAYFLGRQNDAQLQLLYSSAELFVFPSRTDTLGQVVLEAQASGLPVLVSDEGGPREMMDDGVTGKVLPATDEVAWVKQIGELLDDESLRQRMSRSAASRAGRFSLAKTFGGFWEEHFKAVTGQGEKRDPMPPVASETKPVESY